MSDIRSVPKGRYVKHVEPVSGSKYVKRVEPIDGMEGGGGVDLDDPDLQQLIDLRIDEALQDFEVSTIDVTTHPSGTGSMSEVNNLLNQYDVNHFLDNKITETTGDVGPRMDGLEESLVAEAAIREAADTGLQAQIDQIEPILEGNTNDITDLKTEVAQNTQDLSDIKPQIAAIEADVEDLDTTVSNALGTQTDLELRIEALEGHALGGKWDLDDRSAARPGMFLAKDNGLQNVTTWDQVTLLQMSAEDKDGTAYTFAEVSVDDVVRLSSSFGGAAFKITTAPQISGDNYNIVVEFLSSTGTPTLAATYSFEFLPAFDPSTYATVEYVDAQLEGVVETDKVNTVTTSFRIKSGNNTLISTSGNELGLYNIAEPSNDAHGMSRGYADGRYVRPADLTDYPTNSDLNDAVDGLATKDYVDTQDSTKLNLSGGTMTGGLKIDMPNNNKAVEIKKSGATGLSINHFTDDEVRVVVPQGKTFKVNATPGGTQRQLIGIGTSGNLNLYHVNTPTSRDHAANMGYVDDQISALSIPDSSEFATQAELADYALKTELAQYAEQSYVDNNFVRKSMFQHYLEAPARLQWRFSNVNNSNADPGDGYFRWHTNTSSGSHYLRVAFQTNTQANIGNSASSDMNITIDNGPIGSIWYWAYDVEQWRLKEQFRINTLRWNYNNHVEFRTTSRNGSKTYTNGTNYFITVGGFF